MSTEGAQAAREGTRDMGSYSTRAREAGGEQGMSFILSVLVPV